MKLSGGCAFEIGLDNLELLCIHISIGCCCFLKLFYSSNWVLVVSIEWLNLHKVDFSLCDWYISLGLNSSSQVAELLDDGCHIWLLLLIVMMGHNEIIDTSGC
jgi:hypothetical protein